MRSDLCSLDGKFLPGVGVDVDSDVGGSGGRATEEADELKSVAFWGICDIKYDPRLPPRDRVRVLELGDGRSSRFSHHGRAIKQRFDAHYRMDRTPIKRAVMTENKKLTHDVFAIEGCSHLRPPTAAYPRRYNVGLAEQVCRDLAVGEGGAVVLKLCNRSRGAGIIVVQAANLDSVLREVLSPPLQPAAVVDWLAQRTPLALREEPSAEASGASLLEEQRLHWWSNECPLFIVELCCHSIPVAKDPDSDDKFDGTLRVAFALYRQQGPETEVNPFQIDWLGGYWKLPKAPVGCGSEGDLFDMNNRIVSSFNSVDKRTAPITQEHLQEVYDALTPALPRIFGSGQIGVQMIMNIYRQDALFCSFALARVAASMRVEHMEKALGLFDLAKRKVKLPDQTSLVESLPELSVLSYIDRNIGVCSALQGKWDDAVKHFRSSLQSLPLNSTSHYLEGRYYQEKEQYDKAADCMLKSMVLDPDFKLPYQGFAGCELMRGHHEEALVACLACFRRHPDAPVAQFVAGQSIYHMLVEGVGPGRPDSPDAACLADKARKAFILAQRSVREQWSESDQIMLDYVLAGDIQRAKMPRQELHMWKVHGYRP